MNSTEKVDNSGEQFNCALDKIEEEKMLSKYPTGSRLPNAHSLFLQKRWSKGSKFFDSGDYQMAKQNASQSIKTDLGQVIPTPETVSVRKSYCSMIAIHHPPSIASAEEQNSKSQLPNKKLGSYRAL